MNDMSSARRDFDPFAAMRAIDAELEADARESTLDDIGYTEADLEAIHQRLLENLGIKYEPALADDLDLDLELWMLLADAESLATRSSTKAPKVRSVFHEPSGTRADVVWAERHWRVRLQSAGNSGPCVVTIKFASGGVEEKTVELPPSGSAAVFVGTSLVDPPIALQLRFID